MTTVSIVFINGEFFDVQIGLSNKQRQAIGELITRKNAKANEVGLKHEWAFDDYDVPDIVEFIENIKRGYLLGDPQLIDPQLVEEMAKGSI